MFSLELSAVDVVVERLKLPRHWEPFDVPHVGATVDKRRQHVARVWDKLRSNGLAAGDRLDADAEQAMLVWTRPDVLIVVRADQVTGQRLVLYRAAAANGVGVLSALVGDHVEFDVLKAERLTGRLVAQLPPLRPVPLAEVSVTSGDRVVPEEAEEGSLPFPDDPHAASEDTDMQAMRRFASWPVERFGSFELSVRGRDGRLEPVGMVQFVDTDGGRFLVFSTPLPDGQRRMTFVPSDGSHVRRWLHDQIAIAKEDRGR